MMFLSGNFLSQSVSISGNDFNLDYKDVCGAIKSKFLQEDKKG